MAFQTDINQVKKSNDPEYNKLSNNAKKDYLNEAEIDPNYIQQGTGNQASHRGNKIKETS